MTVAATGRAAEAAIPAEDIKAVPQDRGRRDAIRAAAIEAARPLDRTRPPSFENLQAVALKALAALSLPHQFLGFAIVAADNAFWADEFRAVPFDRRLLLLPKCLSSSEACQGHYDSVGLHCVGCGACAILDLKTRAEDLGYEVIIAEGTSSVVMKVLEGQADAILGVACMDSLEKSFERVADLGIPHQAIPLLTDGCKDTTAELDLIRTAITSKGPRAPATASSYLPLLRATHDIFDAASLAEIIDPSACPSPSPERSANAMLATDSIARDWLLRGGKRLRPFITVSAYAVARHGVEALAPDVDVPRLTPAPVRSFATAIEVLHKASLVHDDIEDRDLFRYGQPTLHRTHGIETAINVGDYLVGLGYRLIASQAGELGAECVADVLARLSWAHLRLCCGQGTELVWDREQGDDLRPIHALQIGALKTAPAFEVALYAGLRAADIVIDDDALGKFAMLVGEGYQVLDDLTDWDEEGDAGPPGQDVLAARPTILRAFALEAGGGPRLATILKRDGPTEDVVRRVRELYTELHAFEKAEALYARLRERALGLATQMGDAPIQDLAAFLVRNILHRR